jgi:Uma2 family endonuclease
MGMPEATLRWTAEMARALPDDGNRYEVIDGALLVTPAPILVHQRAVYLLERALDEYITRHGIGEVLASPADIELEPGTLVQPDVFVVPLRAGGDYPGSWTDVRALLLAIEILSPSSRRHDRVTKRRFFARVGVPEYWVVDLDARRVERWRPGDEQAEVLIERLEWRPEGAGEPFTLDLADFFARVHRGRTAS